MVAYLIEMTGEGPPMYYAPDAGRNTGHGFMGWTTDKASGLGFATKDDAQRFLTALLPRTADTARVVAHRRQDNGS